MITKQWGTVHGVLYPNSTVRDPSIVAALLGFFRNRGTNVVAEIPDRENQVTSAVANNQAWLSDPQANWQAGLDLAEISANLLEAAQWWRCTTCRHGRSIFCELDSRIYPHYARSWKALMQRWSRIGCPRAIRATLVRQDTRNKLRSKSSAVALIPLR